MTSSPPDFSSLSITPSTHPPQRTHDVYESYEAAAARTNNYFATSPPNLIPHQQQHHQISPSYSLGLGQSPPKNKPATRAGLPTQWMMENSNSLNSLQHDARSLSPPTEISSSGGSPPLPSQLPPVTTPSQLPGQASLLASPGSGGPDDEIIPTAIVIKNIPFNVKRETLLDIIASLNIPTPYAFNYHLDPAGAFRGLAFANFRQAQDADAVVAALNGFDVQGRKLRVEYKKVLQAGEKERIEREKALRRMRSMQLEKEAQLQHQQQTPYDEFGAILGGNSVGTPFTPSRSYSSGMSMPTPSYGLPLSGQHASPSLPSMPTPQPYMSSASALGPPLGLTSGGSGGLPLGTPGTPGGLHVHGAPTTPSQIAKSGSSSSTSSSTELDLNDPSTLEIYSRILLFKDDRMRDELAFSRTLSPKQRRVVHLVAQKLGVYHYSIGEGDERYAVVTRIDPEARNAGGRHTLSRAPSSYNMLANSVGNGSSASSTPPQLRVKKSMPDMKTLHTTQPRLNTRSSNGNIREGYATIASPARRNTPGFGTLFGSGNLIGGGSSGSPGGAGAGLLAGVPPLPTSGSAANPGMNGGGSVISTPVEGPSGSTGMGGNSGVVRQPRGPGTSGFGARRERLAVSESAARGLEARTHEPLDI